MGYLVGKKSSAHPHTNMAKAALNMMTLTCAQDFISDYILVNCVDTGWVTDMAPLGVGAKAKTHRTHVVSTTTISQNHHFFCNRRSHAAS